jgi:hypothetical protein
MGRGRSVNYLLIGGNMSIPKIGAVLGVVCAAALIVPVAAGAQTLPSGTNVASLAHIPVSGVAKNHKTFHGHFAVDRFVTRSQKTFAVGTLTGMLGQRHVNLSNVAIPASVASGSAVGAARAHQVATCPVVHLVLGPVNLNLLGLKAALGGGPQHNQPIVLDITAVSGAGNLLGNLLCGVSNLLNGTGTTPLTSSVTPGLLNLANTLLSTPALNTL